MNHHSGDLAPLPLAAARAALRHDRVTLLQWQRDRHDLDGGFSGPGQIEKHDHERFHFTAALGLEGTVSKRVTSRYKSGSCLIWVKVKNPAYERRGGEAEGHSRKRINIAAL